jgi:hypothetical protein
MAATPMFWGCCPQSGGGSSLEALGWSSGGVGSVRSDLEQCRMYGHNIKEEDQLTSGRRKNSLATGGDVGGEIVKILYTIRC